MTTVVLQKPGLLFNGVDVMMDDVDPVYGYRIRVMAGETDFGNPDAVISEVQSQLQDGDLQRVDRYGNRQATLDLRIDAPDSPTPGAAVAAGQAAVELAAGFDGWAELEWTSPLAGAETSVMEMTSAVVGKTLNPTREINEALRIITVTIGARPHVRPKTPDVFVAPTVIGASTTPVDTGSSTTGWSMLSARPPAATNQVTDPTFTSGLSGWSKGTATEGLTNVGGALQATTAAAATGGSMYANSPLYPVTPGVRYYFGAAIERQSGTDLGGSAGPGPTGFLYRWFKSDGGQIGADASVIGWLAADTAAWFTTNAVAPAGATHLAVIPFTDKARYNTTPASLWFGKFRIHDAYVTDSDLGNFTGATPDTPAVNYAWTSTANASTSTATWTTPTIAVVAGAVKGSVYGRHDVTIRRTGTITMTSQPFIRIRGTASTFADRVTVADNGGAPLTPVSYRYNQVTGAYDITIQRPEGFTAVDVGLTRNTLPISTSSELFVAVDSIDITDNPFATGKVQTRQIEIGGTRRTELSLSVLGLNPASTTPIGLGGQVLVHSAAKGSDGRAKFLSVRTAATPAGASTDTAATSGSYNTLGTTGTVWSFPASLLLPGNYLAVASVRASNNNTNTLSVRALVDPAVGDNIYDPPTGYRTIPAVFAASAKWPQAATGAWTLLPLGLFRLPPADLEDPAATIGIEIFRGAAGAVDLDDIFLLNADVGQATLINTTISGGSYSAVRLDAPTVANGGSPAVWVGVANGPMLADPTRLQGFEPHEAAPGLLQVTSITPGCDSSRLAGESYRRYAHDTAAAA